MDAPDLCEVCAREVAPDEAYRVDMAVGDMMCPAPMSFHPGCYEKATEIWEPGDAAACGYDPDYPETGRWPSPTVFE